MVVDYLIWKVENQIPYKDKVLAVGKSWMKIVFVMEPDIMPKLADFSIVQSTNNIPF